MADETDRSDPQDSRGDSPGPAGSSTSAPRPDEAAQAHAKGDIGDEVAALGSGYARFAGVGVQFAVTILVFAYGGYRLDLWLDSSPWFLIVGVFLGFLGGMLSLVSKVKKVTAESKRQRPR